MLSKIKKEWHLLRKSIKIMTRLWVAHANTPYHHLLRTQSTAPFPKKLVIPKPGIKDYGASATSLIIVMVCVGTNTRPPIANRVFVMCNPTPRLPQPTWIMMSHQTKSLLTINLFWPMMEMTPPPCLHRHLIWAAKIQNFKRKLQWICL